MFAFVLAVDEIYRRAEEFLVHRLHPFGVERAGVFYDLLSDSAIGRIDCRIIDIAGLALEHAARTELRSKLRILAGNPGSAAPPRH